MILEAFALAVAPLWEREWAYISTDVGQSSWFFEAGTVKLDRGRLRAWIFIDHSRDTTESARHSIGLVELDCANSIARWIQMAKYQPNGHPIPYRVNSEPYYVIPGSIMESVKERICQS